MTTNLATYITKPVPRYTSYPTVPHFKDAVGADTYSGWLVDLDPATPISLYLHVPFCRQVCWYCGCNMKLVARYEPVGSYVDTLIKEIDLLARHLPARMTIGHLHWGGGTPTALEPRELERVMDQVNRRFAFADDAEIAIEGDPRTITREMIKMIGRLGFNRASFGVQEFDPTVQKAINRNQPPEMVAACVHALRTEGVGAINFDLIYGLPHQSVATLMKTIEQASAMSPDRVALFGYAHVPWMAKRQRMIDDAALPGANERIAQARAAAERLAELGYEPVGLDHFALPGDELAEALRAGRLRRNFQGYTTDQSETLLGVGATSIGRTPNGYVQNIADTGAWSHSIEAGRLPVAKGHAFRDQDIVRAHVIERLMCFGEVDLRATARERGLRDDWCAVELEEVAQHAADGLVTMADGVLRLTKIGRPLVRPVAAVFDEYFGHAPARHSVAV